jgi:hypothetical protein
MVRVRSEIVFLEIGHIGYQEIENFMLISKMQTCLCDKMSPPKKKKIKFEKNCFLFSSFNNFNWGGGIVSPGIEPGYIVFPSHK